MAGENVQVTADDLDTRLRAANAASDAEPLDAWRALHAVEGARATVIDLYELVARQRGMRAEELSREERHSLGRATMPDVWPGFGTTERSARLGDTIRIVDHDDEWATRYERWRGIIAEALGHTAQRIEHIGSSSVPGLPAKPIVDIQVSVADIEDEHFYVPHLEALGVQLRSRDDLHRYFRPFPDQPRDVHVHVCPTGSAWETDHLLFRDYLRTHEDARDAYARVKRAAAQRWSDDGIAYTDAKSAVILRLLGQARDPEVLEVPPE